MASVDFRNPVVQKALLSVMMAGAVIGVFFFTHLVPFTFPVQPTTGVHTVVLIGKGGNGIANIDWLACARSVQ